jgi:hypothetical protein
MLFSGTLIPPFPSDQGPTPLVICGRRHGRPDSKGDTRPISQDIPQAAFRAPRNSAKLGATAAGGPEGNGHPAPTPDTDAAGQVVD